MRIKTLCSSLCIPKTINEESLRNFLSHEENSLSTLRSSAISVKATETLTPPPCLEKVIPYVYDIGKGNPVRGRQEMQANSKVTHQGPSSPWRCISDHERRFWTRRSGWLKKRFQFWICHLKENKTRAGIATTLFSHCPGVALAPAGRPPAVLALPPHSCFHFSTCDS